MVLNQLTSEPARISKGVDTVFIFTAIKNFIYDPNRYYFFTGANNIHTRCAYEAFEERGIFYALDDIYNYSSEDGFDGRFTIGLGCLSVFSRLRIRAILWIEGVYGRLWYCV